MARKSRLVDARDFVRREVTTQKEADLIRAENAEDFARVKEEKQGEIDVAVESGKEVNPCLPPDPMDTWTPPRTTVEFMKIAERAFPDASLGWRVQWSRTMMERAPLIEKAYLDGLKMGRTLREQADHGVGWNYPSLMELVPKERTFVMNQIRAVIMRDRAKESN